MCAHTKASTRAHIHSHMPTCMHTWTCPLVVGLRGPRPWQCAHKSAKHRAWRVRFVRTNQGGFEPRVACSLVCSWLECGSTTGNTVGRLKHQHVKPAIQQVYTQELGGHLVGISTRKPSRFLWSMLLCA